MQKLNKMKLEFVLEVLARTCTDHAASYHKKERTQFEIRNPSLFPNHFPKTMTPECAGGRWTKNMEDTIPFMCTCDFRGTLGMKSVLKSLSNHKQLIYIFLVGHKSPFFHFPGRVN